MAIVWTPDSSEPTLPLSETDTNVALSFSVVDELEEGSTETPIEYYT